MYLSGVNRGRLVTKSYSLDIPFIRDFQLQRLSNIPSTPDICGSGTQRPKKRIGPVYLPILDVLLEILFIPRFKYEFPLNLQRITDEGIRMERRR